MSKTVIDCPLCGWRYEVPPLTAIQRDPNTLASVFGPGIMAQHASNQQAETTEAALREHFKSHQVHEWLAKVTSLQWALPDAERWRWLEAATSQDRGFTLSQLGAAMAVGDPELTLRGVADRRRATT